MKTVFSACAAVSLCVSTQAFAQEQQVENVPSQSGETEEQAQPITQNTPPETSDDVFLAQDINPDAPLEPLPDMEVDWPDFEQLPALPEMGEEQENSSLEDLVPIEQQTETAEIVESERVGERDEEVAAFQDRQDSNEASFTGDLSQGDFGYIVDLVYLDSSPFVNDLQDEFEDRFGQLSKLRALDNDEANAAQISRRAGEDTKLLDQLLRNYGYYDSDIFRLIERGQDAQTLRVEFGLQLGSIYRYGDINLDGLSAAGNDVPRFRTMFGLQSGDALNSDDIIAAKTRLDEGLAENGYAFAQLGEPDLLIDHEERTGDLTLPVTPEDKFAFGQIRVGDKPLMSAKHLQRIARFDAGDLYKRSMVEDLRRAILATGLVSSLTLTKKATDDAVAQTENGELRTVDIEVETIAAPLRTVAGELGYGTGEGIRVEASWEHRNFFPPEGLVRVRGVAGTQEQLLSFLYRRNNFKERDQVLTAQFLASNVNRNAFDARTLLLRAGIERQSNLIFQKKWTWSVGAEILATDERDITADNLSTARRTFFIGALPASLNYDGSDDLLNPTSGFRLGGTISPEVSLQGSTYGYVRTQIDASYYQPVSEKVVIAGRVRFGSIAGTDLLQVAPSRRLYAGGGASVRGYGFNEIGPRDVNNDPIGGRSLSEFSLEARVRFGNFGVVPFVDAGNIYSSSIPDNSNLRFGAGIGLRYYSSFGPLRVDVATPINPQPGDSRIGVYISLGQAF